MCPNLLAFIGNIGMPELIVLALLGLLIFGKRLPEVGKSIGRGIVEFKRGLSGIEDDLDQASQTPPRIEQHQPHQQSTAATDRPEPATPGSDSAPNADRAST